MTLDLVIKIVFSSILGFIALNSFFRYHFSSERFVTSAIIIFTVVLYFFRDGNNKEYLMLIILGIFVTTVFFRILYDSKKEYGYFLLNINKEEYNIIREEIMTRANKLEIKEENIIFQNRFPHILYIKKESGKKVRELIKEIDTYVAKKKKTFSMRIYWHLIVVLILIAAIWRF
ncbi:hypothetical protein ACAG96_01465 [Candidatus Izemoplasma sp. B36]|uniref:hypothetical protein n=1 Tax=Candidatus Izemoplasma sp. B36 TaxID=3242468 RepID=UPI003556D53D